MNRKIQAILLLLVLELKKLQWKVSQDWRIDLKSEGHVVLQKSIPVEGEMADEKWRDTVDITMELKLVSPANDNITFFPEFHVYGNIFIDGGVSKDINYQMDADVAFTEEDLKKERREKITTGANRVNRLIQGHVDQEYGDYIDMNEKDIQQYRQGGYKADNFPER